MKGEIYKAFKRANINREEIVRISKKVDDYYDQIRAINKSLAGIEKQTGRTIRQIKNINRHIEQGRGIESIKDKYFPYADEIKDLNEKIRESEEKLKKIREETNETIPRMNKIHEEIEAGRMMICAAKTMPKTLGPMKEPQLVNSTPARPAMPAPMTKTASL